MLRRTDMPARLPGGLALSLALIASWVVPLEAAAADGPEAKAAQAKKVAAPYSTDHAKPLEAKEEVVNRADDHTQLRVEFNGIKGDRVPGYLYVPGGKAA